MTDDFEPIFIRMIIRKVFRVLFQFMSAGVISGLDVEKIVG